MRRSRECGQDFDVSWNTETLQFERSLDARSVMSVASHQLEQGVSESILQVIKGVGRGQGNHRVSSFGYI